MISHQNPQPQLSGSKNTNAVKPWYVIQKRTYENGYITDIMIGDSKCMFVVIKNVIGLYKQALQDNPFELYGLI